MTMSRALSGGTNDPRGPGACIRWRRFRAHGGHATSLNSAERVDKGGDRGPKYSGPMSRCSGKLLSQEGRLPFISLRIVLPPGNPLPSDRMFCLRII